MRLTVKKERGAGDVDLVRALLMPLLRLRTIVVVLAAWQVGMFPDFVQCSMLQMNTVCRPALSLYGYRRTVGTELDINHSTPAPVKDSVPEEVSALRVPRLAALLLRPVLLPSDLPVVVVVAAVDRAQKSVVLPAPWHESDVDQVLSRRRDYCATAVPEGNLPLVVSDHHMMTTVSSLDTPVFYSDRTALVLSPPLPKEDFRQLFLQGSDHLLAEAVLVGVARYCLDATVWNTVLGAVVVQVSGLAAVRNPPACAEVLAVAYLDAGRHRVGISAYSAVGPLHLYVAKELVGDDNCCLPGFQDS